MRWRCREPPCEVWRLFLEAGHPEAIYYKGVAQAVTAPLDPKGIESLREVAYGGDHAAAYLLAILLYHQNSLDEEALALFYDIAGGPQDDGRWVINDELVKARATTTADVNDIVSHNPCLLLNVNLRAVFYDGCVWPDECTHQGRFCSAQCRILHEFKIWALNFATAVFSFCS